MLEFIGYAYNLPFAVALVVLLCLSVLELLSTLWGVAFSGLLDQLLPDWDVDVDVDVDASPEVSTALEGGMGGGHVGAQLLDWLHLGRVPTLILLLIFLAGFGVCGLALQYAALQLLGGPLPLWLASVLSWVSALPIMHWSGAALARIVPREESSAVSRDSLVGKFATVVTGTARLGNPAQAKLRDEYGQIHYVLVEPEEPGVEFAPQSQVILLSVQGAIFKAVQSDLPLLSDID